MLRPTGASDRAAGAEQRPDRLGYLEEMTIGIARRGQRQAHRQARGTLEARDLNDGNMQQGPHRIDPRADLQSAKSATASHMTRIRSRPATWDPAQEVVGLTFDQIGASRPMGAY